MMEWGDDFEYLKKECSCGNLKSQNMRLEHGEPVFEGDQVAIDDGGVEHKPVC